MDPIEEKIAEARARQEKIREQMAALDEGDGAMQQNVQKLNTMDPNLPPPPQQVAATPQQQVAEMQKIREQMAELEASGAVMQESLQQLNAMPPQQLKENLRKLNAMPPPPQPVAATPQRTQQDQVAACMEYIAKQKLYIDQATEQQKREQLAAAAEAEPAEPPKVWAPLPTGQPAQPTGGTVKGAIPAGDIVSLAHVFASNVDDDGFTIRCQARAAKIEKLRLERTRMENGARRQQEVEEHLGRMRTLGATKRLEQLREQLAQTTSAPPPRGTAEEKEMETRQAATLAALNAAREKYMAYVKEQGPKWEMDRQAQQEEARAQIRTELAEIETRRSSSLQGFATELKAQSELAREAQLLEQARALELGENAAQQDLRRTLFLRPDGAPSGDGPRPNPKPWLRSPVGGHLL